MKKKELLKTDHDTQLKWLKNQITKIANEGAKSFSNPDVAERAYNKLDKENLVISKNDIEHYISVYLSDVGLKKLITTLRVSLHRANTQILQVKIERRNQAKLNELVRISGRTRIQIINELIESTIISEFKKEEEQLSIDLKM